MELFRPEVAEAKRERWISAVHLEPPRSGWIALIVASVVLLALVALLFFGRYARQETVSGRLVPQAGAISVASSASGTVLRLLAKEGAFVRAGMPIAIVSGERETELGSARAATIAQLQAQVDQLLVEEASEPKVAALEIDALDRGIAALSMQAGSLSAELSLQERRNRNATLLLKQYAEAADKGVVSKAQVLQQEDVVLDQQAQRESLLRRHSEIAQQRNALVAQRSLLPIEQSGKASELDRKIATLRQSILQQEAERQIIVRAPGNGVVSNLLVREGQAVSANDKLAVLLPKREMLEVELWAPDRAIAFLGNGQRVIVRYAAFPYQRYGQHAGRVVEVSANALAPSEIARISGLPVAEPRYKVRVALPAQWLRHDGVSHPLKAGMAVTAQVVLDERRLVDWVIDPLYSRTAAAHDAELAPNG